ncbi:MAG: carbohydrate ABC transporter substrate-binding protein [Ruminococcus sp.]|nr:carbohydrate ABC transporter substrate-binding protein [Ruminococcus sp.]
MNKRSRLLALVMAALMLMLTGCEGDPVVRKQNTQVQITLSWWGNDSRNEYTIAAVQRFEKLHPDIKVKCSYSEWQGYEARSQVQMISGTEADVMQINVGWLGQYSADGTGYYDIEKLSDTVDLSNFTPEMLDYGRRNGVLNAIPIAMNAETVYINKDVYSDFGLFVPQTWDDIFQAAKVFSKHGIYALAGASKSIWLYCIAYAEQCSGRQFFNDKSEITFTADDLKIMIEFYNRLVREKVIPKVEDFQRFNIDNGTYAGVVAWVSDALNYYKGLIEKGTEVIAADYTAFDPSKSGSGWYAKPATLYALSRNTEHPKEAAMLLDFMLNSREWAELQGVEKGIPVSASGRRYLEEIGKLSGLQYEASQVMEKNTFIKPMDPFTENADLYETFIEYCDLVLFDKSTSDEAAKELYKIYSENYKMAPA